VDRAVDRFEELPKHGGGGVTEGGAGSAGEDRGHAAPVEAQATVSHGVDAVMDPVEPAAFRSFCCRLASDPNRFKLLKGDYSMLP
jgi:hypothetical protein